jgi:hypothetical protein
MIRVYNPASRSSRTIPLPLPSFSKRVFRDKIDIELRHSRNSDIVPSDTRNSLAIESENFIIMTALLGFLCRKIAPVNKAESCESHQCQTF